MEEQSLAAARGRGVGERQRVSGGFRGGAEEEEMYGRSVDLAAAGDVLDPGPSPTPTAALFYPSPPPPQTAADDGVAMGKKTVGGVAGHWNYDVAGEVAHLKRFELHLEKWQQVLKDREDALNRREQVVEEALSRRDREMVEALGPLLEQLDRKKNDDTCDWELGVVAMIIISNVLVSLRHIRTLLPRGYFTAIVLTLAVLWVPFSVFLSNKVSGRYSSRRKFSYHVARLISLCFSIVVVYFLYLLSAV